MGNAHRPFQARLHPCGGQTDIPYAVQMNQVIGEAPIPKHQSRQGRDFKAVHNFTLGADIVKYIKLRDWIYYKTHLCISKIKYGDITRYVFFVKWDDFRIC